MVTMCDVDTTQHIGRGLERECKRADKHRGNTARATTTERGTGEYPQIVTQWMQQRMR